MIEYLNPMTSRTPVSAVLFDFDGTISTLRHGWESVMKPLMAEYILKPGDDPTAVSDLIDRYVDESTGIQTIHQMKWLVAHAAPGHPTDPWFYKDEYNRRLLGMIAGRRRALEAGAPAEGYLISGAKAALAALRARGVSLYVASGTDEADVRAEAHALGVDGYFDAIAGAPARAETDAKAAALRQLIDGAGLKGQELAVVGDGRVEIALGREKGARTLGLATDEERRRGLSEVKKRRLIAAGADALAGDFEDLEGFLAFLGLE
ncbi:MAG: HAD family hydrolase [Clostridia bacterium]|nr:HAD family hydrolase [Clostridia bacterium]